MEENYLPFFFIIFVNKNLKIKIMYWIPSIFIFVELLYISYISNLVKFANCKVLLKKYKNEQLSDYIINEYKSIENVSTFIGFLLIFEMIYFIVGFFYPIWIFSIIYIIYTIVYTIIIKNKPEPIEKIVKKADLSGFQTNDIKLSRLLKLNELKGIKIYKWTWYILPTIKIAIFIAIIVLHYNYAVL